MRVWIKSATTNCQWFKLFVHLKRRGQIQYQIVLSRLNSRLHLKSRMRHKKEGRSLALKDKDVFHLKAKKVQGRERTSTSHLHRDRLIGVSGYEWRFFFSRKIQDIAFSYFWHQQYYAPLLETKLETRWPMPTCAAVTQVRKIGNSDLFSFFPAKFDRADKKKKPSSSPSKSSCFGN